MYKFKSINFVEWSLYNIDLGGCVCVSTEMNVLKLKQFGQFNHPTLYHHHHSMTKWITIYFLIEIEFQVPFSLIVFPSRLSTPPLLKYSYIDGYFCYNPPEDKWNKSLYLMCVNSFFLSASVSPSHSMTFSRSLSLQQIFFSFSLGV